MTAEALKEAIAELPDNERHSLAAWLREFEFDAWDKQMVKDFSPGGREHGTAGEAEAGRRRRQGACLRTG